MLGVEVILTVICRPLHLQQGALFGGRFETINSVIGWGRPTTEEEFVANSEARGAAGPQESGQEVYKETTEGDEGDDLEDQTGHGNVNADVAGAR